MKRLFKVTLITLVVCLVSIPLLSCASESDSAPVSESQVVTVQRGDLIIDITAVGNLALSFKEELAFEIAGTVEEVLVEEGDTVEEGQVLAKLDTSEWDDQLRTLEKALITAQRTLATEERDLLTDERDVADKELAVRQAELDLQRAENELYQTDELKTAYDNVDIAKFELEVAQVAGDWQLVLYWQDRLEQAREDLKYLTGSRSSDSSLSDSAALEFETAKLKVEQEQRDLEESQIAVEDATLAVYYAQLDKEDAEQDVEDAQDDLNEAKALSPIITAPFDGFITKVNVEGGDEVLKGTVAVQLADPTKFEADVLVSEMDIFQVKLGGNATVQVDAMSEISLPAEVTHISPTATIQQGVVNYAVKVEVQSLEAVMQEKQEAREDMMQEIAPGELPERLKQAIEEGRLTQEQAEEMMKQRQQGQGEQQGQMPAMLPEDFQLREGLTVTVSILVEERNNVLLVPNGAITHRGMETYVQVLKDGVVEERSIRAGISNWQYTEVIEGLSEGEKVIIPETTATPTTSQQGRGMPFLPGGGGPH